MDDSAPEWLVRGSAHVWRPYCQHATAEPPLPVVAAHGCRLVLADGRQLVDGTASWWTAAHGYGHPHIRDSVASQLARLPHVAFGGLAHESAYSLASRLTALLPKELSRVFFVESGSVAVEVALKMAIGACFNRGQPERRRVVSFFDAYHGDTFATMALCDPHSGMHRAFAGLALEPVHLEVPRAAGGNFDRVFADVAPTVACVVIEPLVQCAGGMRFHEPEVLRRLRRACDEHGVLLVFDEIATGFFRTGSCFAFEQASVAPDILTVGKALTGGTLPLAAAIASERVFEAFLGPAGDRALQHGPTYMGNPLACAAAHASLDLFESSGPTRSVALLEQALAVGLSPLARAPGVRDVRVKGAIGVVEMEPGAAPPSRAFADRGAFLRPLRLPGADVIYLMPPLVISPADLSVLFEALGNTLQNERR